MYKYLIIIISLPLLLVGCGDYSIQLKSGYHFARTDSSNHMILNSHNTVVVFPDVYRYIDLKSHIVGFRKKPQYLISNTPEFSEGFGYFLLDKVTGELHQGLSEDELIQELRSNGLKNDIYPMRLLIQISHFPSHEIPLSEPWIAILALLIFTTTKIIISYWRKRT